MANFMNLTSKVLLYPENITTTKTGAAVDLSALNNPGGRAMKAILTIGSQDGTAPSNTVTIEHSDTTTAADFAAITGAAFTAVTTTGTATEEIHFKTMKRYVRAVATVTSDTTSSVVAAWLIGEERIY
jgi:uncharacterized protein (UPF0264 family)